MDFATLYINLKLLFKVCCILIIDLLLITIIILLLKNIYYKIIIGDRPYKDYKGSDPKLQKLTEKDKSELN